MPLPTNSQNPQFNLLANELERVARIDRQRLLDALFLMRAPWSLQAIVPCCRYLLRLGQQLPGVLNPPFSENQARQLEVLRAIASLDGRGSPSTFMAVHVVRRKHGGIGLEHPIYGYSGDSGLAELLVMRPPEADEGGLSAADEYLPAAVDAPMSAHERAFVFLRAWFARQTLSYQSRRMSRAEYDAYLLGAGLDRLKQGEGNRFYAASLAIRDLGAPQSRNKAIALALVIGSLEDARNASLPSALERLGSGNFDLGEIPAHVDPFLIPLLPEINLLTTFSKSNAYSMRMASLTRWVRLVWGTDEVRERKGRGRRSIRRDNIEIDIYPDALARIEEVSLAGVGPVRILGIFPRPESVDAPLEPVADDDCLDDPEEEEPGEALVEIILVDGDPTQAYYASKSRVHHIERANAMLRWPVSRMSAAATRAVASCVASASRMPPESTRCDRAWLSLGLSLLTGRPLADTTAVSMLGTPESQERLAIDPVTHTLIVPVPRPDLHRFAWKSDPFPKYCTPWASTLRLPLPEAWWSLVDRLVGRTERADKAVATHASNLIGNMPDPWHVTAAGICGALRLAVQEGSQDDLALVKVMTNAQVANARNLIHYASYPRAELEESWRRIVQTWAGPLPGHTLQPDRPDERVGSPYGIDAAKIKTSIVEVRRRFDASVAKVHWAAVYNQLTLYTAMWLGLATAGRRACQPVPHVVLADGWALVRDKHHPDESTDRYVPLTNALLQQIGALRALTHALSLTEPGLALPKPEDEHALVLYTIVVKKKRNGEKRFMVKPFQPKHTDKTTVLRDLPGNWGRKLVRSGIAPPQAVHPEAVELTGWFKDAGLGHWTQGRHPWTTSSTFPATQFRAQWLAMQGEWERELGFELLAVPGLDISAYKLPTILPPPPPSLRKELAEKYTEAALSDEAVEAMLRRAWPAHQVESVLGKPAIAAQRLVELEVVKPDAVASKATDPEATSKQDGADPEGTQRLIEDVVASHAKEPREKVRALARRLCRYVRTHYHVNVFVSEPHRRFTRNWLVNGYEFGCLAYVEAALLPAIANDLAHLPKRDGSPAGIAVDLGRLLVALAWRGGLLSTGHLDSAMAYLAGGGHARDNTSANANAGTSSDQDENAEDKDTQSVTEEDGRGDDGRGAVLSDPTPIYAIGDLRVMELRRVSTRRSSMSIARTVLLEPYLAALLTVERVAMREPLRAVFTRIGSHRAHYWNRVFRAYLGALGLPRTISLSAFLGALRQRLMLRTCPVLAAYASGEVLTQDLPVKLLCQLAGLKPPMEAIPPVEPSDARESLQEPRELPEDLRTPFTEFGRHLAKIDSDQILVWLERASKFRRSATEPEQRLICSFAQHQLQYYYQQGHRGGLQAKQRRTLRENLSVVWEGLIHAHFTWGDGYVMDEPALESMSLATEEMYSMRRHHGAWAAFRKFLRNEEFNHAGFVIRDLDAKGPLNVNARIFSRSDQDEIASALNSMRSRIVTQANRRSASRHYVLTRSFGARRAEIEALRWQDVDNEIIRIQAYGDHRLKTPAAERILPSGYLPPATWDDLKAGQAPGVDKVIDSEAHMAADGNNFFAATAWVMKQVTGDVNMSHHPLRHTVASALTLKLIGNSVDLKRLDQDLPWVTPLLPEDDQVAVLIGSAGEGGQGLKAEALMLGHLHETSTLEYYTHTLGIGLYADVLSLPRIPLHIAFHHRASSRATLFRRNKEAEDEAWAADRTDRLLRDAIEQSVLRKAHPGSSPLVWAGDQRPAAVWGVECSPEADAWIGKMERWTNRLLDPDKQRPEALVDDGLESVREALRGLAAIPSGKRGSSLSRHVLTISAADGTPIMEMPGWMELMRAAVLMTWLLQRKDLDPDDYAWLLDKWAKTSARHDGSMRLDGDADMERAQRVAATMDDAMALVVEPVALSRARAARSRHRRQGKAPQYRMRIRFTREGEDFDDGRSEAPLDPSHSQRGLQAVRWTLSWAWVERESELAR